MFGSMWCITFGLPTRLVLLVMIFRPENIWLRVDQSASLIAPGPKPCAWAIWCSRGSTLTRNSSNVRIFEPPVPMRCIPHEARVA